MRRIMKIYFSPAGTTKKVCSAAADTMASELGLPAETFDFTLPQARQTFPELSSEDLVIFAVPTYAGRVPNVLLKYLDTIKGGGSKAIALVTFGNRNFDSSLAELCDILNKHNFQVIAAGAVSCQHAFSDTLGKGRPDSEDMAEICGFIHKVYHKLSESCSALDTADIPAIRNVSGAAVSPDSYGGYYQPRDKNGNHIDIRKVTPKVSDSCTNCGLCSGVCPMGSISADDPRVMTGICIKCNACLKNCPASARYFDNAGYLYHKTELEDMYSRRAQNSFFL